MLVPVAKTKLNIKDPEQPSCSIRDYGPARLASCIMRRLRVQFLPFEPE
ncbi:hypothetical protein X739_04165 [Mesorhizobium sp. LNHC220B00]|nr:hypothetical protein X739_04165 [Mesorhizobium sp. LNHC220B00]